MQPFVQTEVSLREVHDAITDMLKQLANEPSVGLYFVQQHVHRAVPAMVALKAQIAESTQEAEYVTQDARDALNSVKSMKECGPAVLERMIKTIDSSLPRLASLRSTNRDDYSSDGMTRNKDNRDSLLTEHPEKQRNSPNSPKSILIGESSAEPAALLSSSIAAQNECDDPLSTRESSGQAPVENKVSGLVTSEGDYTSYVRNIFDSAYRKASNVTSAANWTSSNKASKVVSPNVADGHLGPNQLSAAGTEKTPSQYVPAVLRSCGPGKIASASTSSTAIRGVEEPQSVPRFTHDKERRMSSGNTPRVTATHGDVTDFRKPGQYVRAVIGSAIQTAGNVKRDGSNFVWAEGEGGQNTSAASEGKPAESWGWLRLPTQALRTLGKRSTNSQSEDGRPGTTTMDDVLNRDAVAVAESGSSEGDLQMLDVERANYEIFAAEQAAQLERWLDESNEEEKHGK